MSRLFSGLGCHHAIYRACLLRLLICCRSSHDMPRILSYAYAPTWYQHIARLALISMEVLNTVMRMSDSVALGHSCLVRSPIVILAGSLQYLPFSHCFCKQFGGYPCRLVYVVPIHSNSSAFLVPADLSISLSWLPISWVGFMEC